MINPIYIINNLSYATTTINLAFQLACEFYLEINIGLLRVQIQYGGGTVRITLKLT